MLNKGKYYFLLICAGSSFPVKKFKTRKRTVNIQHTQLSLVMNVNECYVQHAHNN